jgi:TonB family protein
LRRWIEGVLTMLPLLLLASIPSALSSSFAAGPESADQAVRQSANGEFLWRYYPPDALKRGEQGKVAFRLTIEPTGTVSACGVTESSGFATLDKETCDIIGLYARVEPARNSEGRAIRATQNGFIVWRLPPGATKVASVSANKTMPKPAQLVCRKDPVTGSLIATVKQCLTRDEWKQQEQVNRDAMEQMGQGKGFFDPHAGSPDTSPAPTGG